MDTLDLERWQNIQIKKTNNIVSYCETKEQMYNQTKTETRRIGWQSLVAGTTFWGVEKSQGRRDGEPLIRIWPLLVLENYREPLHEIDKQGCIDEGFPHYEPEDFIKKFIGMYKCKRDDDITVIKFAFINYQGLLDGCKPIMPHESYQSLFSGEKMFSPVSDRYDPRYNKINETISSLFGLNDKQWNSYQSDLLKLKEWQDKQGNKNK